MHNTRVSARYQARSPGESEQTSSGKDNSSPKRHTVPPAPQGECAGTGSVREAVQLDAGPPSGQCPPPRVPAPRLSPVPIPVAQDDAWSEFILESKTGLAVSACFRSSRPHDASVRPCAVWAARPHLTCAHSLSPPSPSNVRPPLSATSATLHGRFLDFTTWGNWLSSSPSSQ